MTKLINILFLFIREIYRVRVQAIGTFKNNYNERFLSVKTRQVNRNPPQIFSFELKFTTMNDRRTKRKGCIDKK